jgi:hypothetical protein
MKRVYQAYKFVLSKPNGSISDRLLSVFFFSFKSLPTNKLILGNVVVMDICLGEIIVVIINRNNLPHLFAALVIYVGKRVAIKER